MVKNIRNIYMSPGTEESFVNKNIKKENRESIWSNLNSGKVSFGSGFVFNRSVKLTSPASYFRRESQTSFSSFEEKEEESTKSNSYSLLSAPCSSNASRQNNEKIYSNASPQTIQNNIQSMVNNEQIAQNKVLNNFNKINNNLLNIKNKSDISVKLNNCSIKETINTFNELTNNFKEINNIRKTTDRINEDNKFKEVNIKKVTKEFNEENKFKEVTKETNDRINEDNKFKEVNIKKVTKDRTNDSTDNSKFNFSYESNTKSIKSITTSLNNTGLSFLGKPKVEKKEGTDETKSLNGFRQSMPSKTVKSINFMNSNLYNNGRIQFQNKFTESPKFAPIDVIYNTEKKTNTVKTEPLKIEKKIEIKDEIKKTENLMKNITLYAPGAKLTISPTIKIAHTILNYEENVDTTKFYIKIESNVSWMVCKTIQQLKSFIPESISWANIPISPLDRNVRNSLIQTTLNSKIDTSIQPFILSDIVDTPVYRTSYLLMNENIWRCFLFKFVGKALICYNNGKVHKIILLPGCVVIPISIEGFKIEKDSSSVELYATCEKERDEWIKDIRAYISKI